MDRDIVGDWKVFGAVVEVKKDENKIVEKFIKAGFAATMKSSNKHQIQLFINEKFFQIAKSMNFDVPVIKGNNEAIAAVIEKNKEEMKKVRQLEK